MLSAYDKNGKLITLLEGLPQKQTFSCPACGGAVRLKKGSVMRPHFAHVSLKDCHFYTENESDEHLCLKAELYHSLSKSEQVEVEAFLPDLGQIADLLVNKKLALEVQCSRLSQERLCQRSRAYQSQGFQVLWLLGKKLWLGQKLTDLQKQLLYFSQNMGFHIWELDVQNRQLRLKYMIHEDLFGKLYYLTKSASFDDDLMVFFRQPFVQQEMAQYEVPQMTNLALRIQKQLMARNPRWLCQQEIAYSQGANLIAQTDADFYPQVRPPQSPQGFCQVARDLSGYSAAFFRYYRGQENKSRQILYPPAFYVKMETKKR